MSVRVEVRAVSVVSAFVLIAAVASSVVSGQEPVAWGSGRDPVANTLSIIGIDPATGESGVTVTSRVNCVGNLVPFVRPGVGAVATQGGVRREYGDDLLTLLAQGISPQDALDRVVAADQGRENRQVGVIALDGRSAQWTGKQQYGAEQQGDWVHMRRGLNYAAQGNALVTTQVVDAMAETFERSEGSGRALADRLIEALWAGQRLGGDFRHGAKQSAAVLVADPRPGASRRQDGITVDISVCEHAEPVGEMRRVYDAVSETLGYRPIQQFAGRDVLQLKLMLHALGYYRPDVTEIPVTGAGANLYTEEAVRALDAFRAAQQWGTTVPGFVDGRVIDRLWQRLEEKGAASAVRRQLRELQVVR